MYIYICNSQDSFCGASCGGGAQVCDFKHNWLRVRTPVEEMIYFIYFRFFALVFRQSAALSCAGKWAAECNSRQTECLLCCARDTAEAKKNVFS